jgi:hypothetical protein
MREILDGTADVVRHQTNTRRLLGDAVTRISIFANASLLSGRLGQSAGKGGLLAMAVEEVAHPWWESCPHHSCGVEPPSDGPIAPTQSGAEKTRETATSCFEIVSRTCWSYDLRAMTIWQNQWHVRS